ncbi:MAG: DUF5107 domain-containing protein, partial [Ginsengibacter sp.]
SGFAPFYAARAALFSEAAGEQQLTDLKKAIDLDKDEWRYSKLLSEYYIAHGDNGKALSVAEPFYKTHDKNYIIGMLYAKTLLLNNRYRQCSDLLAAIDILPFEGATVGRELYHEAALMQALEAMKNKNYSKALSLVEDAKKWPQNLGVGKPYPENIDERLEDWVTYLCYQKQGKREQAQRSLQAIVLFNPKVENTVSNFLPANDLVTAWALAKLDSKEKAGEWLNGEIKQYPHNKIIAWCRQVFDNKNLPEIGDFNNAEVRILEKLMLVE